MEKTNFIRFSYDGYIWMWPVTGANDEWDFAIPVSSSEEDSSLVLTQDDIEYADDDYLIINGEKVPYIFIEGRNK
jgi:hypothetical protein